MRVVEGDLGGGITVQQRGDLLLRACLPQPLQQQGHVVRVAERDLGGGAVGQRGQLLLRACLPQAVQQAGHGARVVERDLGGGAVGQRGDLLLRARLPQAGQQAGQRARVVERDMGGGPARGADVRWEGIWKVAEVEDSLDVAVGGGILVELRGVTVQAASVGRIPSAAWSPGKAWPAAAAQKSAGGNWPFR